jgi:hypothetical protein
MTLQDIQNAIRLLSRIYVGLGDQETLMRTISALQLEESKRLKKKAEAV